MMKYINNALLAALVLAGSYTAAHAMASKPVDRPVVVDAIPQSEYMKVWNETVAFTAPFTQNASTAEKTAIIVDNSAMVNAVATAGVAQANGNRAVFDTEARAAYAAKDRVCAALASKCK